MQAGRDAWWEPDQHAPHQGSWANVLAHAHNVSVGEELLEAAMLSFLGMRSLSLFAGTLPSFRFIYPGMGQSCEAFCSSVLKGPRNGLWRFNA